MPKWLFLTEEAGAPQERLEELIRERGYGGSLEGLQVIEEAHPA